MKREYLLTILAMGLMASPSFGALTINSPWSPDGPKGTSEKNLYEILNSNFGGSLTAATVGGAANGQQTWSASVGGTLASLIVEYAGNANANSLGVYDTSNPSHQLQIFAGAAGAGATDTLTTTLASGHFVLSSSGGGSLTLAGTTFGFYFNTGSGQTYFSQDANNTADDGSVPIIDPLVQHIATFNYSGFQVLAMEDKSTFEGSDFDYNDMVVKISAVPEPTTVIAGALLLLPFGASTLRMVRRNRAS